MKDPVSKFEEEMHRYEVKGLKKKIKKSAQENFSKYKLKASRKKPVIQKQITLVLLVFTLMWLIMWVMILFN